MQIMIKAVDFPLEGVKWKTLTVGRKKIWDCNAALPYRTHVGMVCCNEASRKSKDGFYFLITEMSILI